MGFFPSPAAAILWNVGAWFLIHCAAAGLTFLVPLSRFRPDGRLFRTRSWERGGRLYGRLCAVREWKDLLPDGAALFRGGFRKRRMAGHSPAYCRVFAAETCRAELSHWLALAAVALFFLWNPWYVALLMIPYAVAANAPCIVAQRFNRPRLLRTAWAMEAHSAFGRRRGSGADA